MERPNYKKRQQHYAQNAIKLGALAKQKMTDNNLTIKSVADCCGMAPKSVRNFINGRTTPSIVALTTVIQSIEYLTTKEV